MLTCSRHCLDVDNRVLTKSVGEKTGNEMLVLIY